MNKKAPNSQPGRMDAFRVSTNFDEFDMSVIHHFLCHDSYWAKGVDMETVRKSVANSLCFGGFIGKRQVAFGRAITDLATYAFLRDIFVLPDFRGIGYGTSLVKAMMSRMTEEGVPAIMLGTADAHDLYAKFGFQLVGNSSRLMVWRKENDSAKA